MKSLRSLQVSYTECILIVGAARQKLKETICKADVLPQFSLLVLLNTLLVIADILQHRTVYSTPYTSFLRQKCLNHAISSHEYILTANKMHFYGFLAQVKWLLPKQFYCKTNTLITC